MYIYIYIYIYITSRNHNNVKVLYGLFSLLESICKRYHYAESMDCYII